MKRKTFTVPDGPTEPRDRIPFFSFGGREITSTGVYVPELRDTSLPVGFDEDGNPLYAPRGFILNTLPSR